MRHALQWFADNGPQGWFGESAPSRAMRKLAFKAGYIQRLPAKNMEVVKYEITDAGRSALANAIAKGI